MKRDAAEAAKGIYKGVKGLVTHSSKGISNSVSKFTGSVYLGFKNI